jgi:hypothetical protein
VTKSCTKRDPDGTPGTSDGREHERGIPALTCSSSGADDGIRTRDPHLGKVVLYQLSHVRLDT